MSSEYQNRLRRNLEQPTPADHPSADVLTAYAEHTLSAREEKEVLQHLSVCAHCREVMYLASEEEEEPATPVSTLPEPRRFRWWTWAVPLAAVLVVGSVYLLQAPTKKAPVSAPEIASARPLPQPAPPPASDQRTPTAEPQPQAPQAVPQGKRAQREEPARVHTGASPSAPSRRAPDEEEKQVPPDLSAGLVSDNAPLSAVAPPPVAKAKSESTAAPASTTVDVTAEGRNVEPLAAAETTSKDAYAFRAQAARQGANKKALASVTGANAVRRDWSVTPQGTVQHLVNGALMPVPIDPEAHFLVAAVFGEDIWVGGKDLVLYHSSDKGAHWVRQIVPTSPPADVTSLQATSAADVTLTLSTGQSFVSHDGGKTWLPLDPPKPR